MKAPLLFSFFLFIVTACVFTLKAENYLAQLFGHLSVLFGVAVFSRNMMPYIVHVQENALHQLRDIPAGLFSDGTS